MSDPVEFTYHSPRLALPLLFAGQAQKEFFVNEALARLDALSHPAIEDESGNPPATPAEGETWLVGSAPSGDWTGHAGELAAFQAGNWLFCAPVVGMTLFNKATGQQQRFDGLWRSAAAVSPPVGGATVDSQARAAINGLVAALVEAGIVS